MQLRLHLCTIFPESPSLNTEFNYEHLSSKLEGQVKVIPQFIKAGYFKKGTDDPDEHDREEVERRNRYLDAVPPGDFLLILDSDETIGGAIELLPQLMTQMRNNLVPVAQIAEIRPSDGGITVFKRPRLIMKMPGMKYKYKHDVIEWNGINILNKDMTMNYAKAHQIIFVHDIIPEQVEILKT